MSRSQLACLFLLLLVTTVPAGFFAHEPNPAKRAILKIGIALVVIRCILGGAVMHKLRGRAASPPSGLALRGGPLLSPPVQLAEPGGVLTGEAL